MENEFVVCQNCGEKNPIRNNYCQKCAAPLRETFEQKVPQQKYEQNNSEFIICKNCGEKNPEINDYCQVCSSLLKEYYKPQNNNSTQQYYQQPVILQDSKNYQKQKSTTDSSFKLTTGKNKGGCLLLIVIIIVIFVFSKCLTQQNNKTNTPTPTQTTEEMRTTKIEALFSSWDGSLPKLNELIKNQMNNPKSFEHVETVYWDMKDYLVVKTTYRGTNGMARLAVEHGKIAVANKSWHYHASSYLLLQ